MIENTSTPGRRGGLLIALVALAVLIAIAVVFGVMQMNRNGNTSEPVGAGAETEQAADPGASGSSDASSGSDSSNGSDASSASGSSASGASGSDSGANAASSNIEGGLKSQSGQVLPKAMGGQEAIDALGDDIEVVAERNGKTVEELKELLLRDHSAKVSKNGFLLYP